MTFTEYLTGKKERMSWIVESSWATGGTMTGGEIIGYDSTIEPDWNLGWQEVLSAGASDLYVQNRVIGPKVLPYVLTFTPANWRWLKYLMSCANSDDGGVKTHTFTQNAAYTSWKMEWARRATTSHVITTIGNFCKSATMTFTKATGSGNEGLLKVAMSCVGQNESEGSSVTSISAGNLSNTPMLYKMVKVVIGGVEYKEVNSGEITIDLGTNENDSRYCNSTFGALLGEPIPGITRISGRYNINIKDKTLYDLWAAGTVVAGACTLLVDIDGTGDNQLLATFSNFFVLGAVAPTNPEGVTSVDVVWAADKFTSLVSRDNVTTY